MSLEKLKVIMKMKGISPEMLAEKSGVPKSTIDKILCGVTPDPRWSTIRDIANALDLSVDELIEYLDITPASLTEVGDVEQLREDLHKTPGMRTLFSAAKGVSKEDLEVAAEMIKRMKKESGYED